MLDDARMGISTLYLYRWEKPAVIIGYGQPVTEVNLNFCRERGLPVLRRITGGTGVLHNRDWAVSFAFPDTASWAKTIAGTYDCFLGLVQGALRLSGIETERAHVNPGPKKKRSPVCFEDIHVETLLLKRKKAVGCAQARRKGTVLVHGTLLFNLDPETYAEIFDVTPGRIRKAMTPLPPVDASELIRSFSDLASELFSFTPEFTSLPDPDPKIQKRYSDSHWAPVPDRTR